MKISWGHGVVIALGAFILFILGMIFLFPIGKQNSELITENYYEEELKYQEVIDAKNSADNLTEKPTVALEKQGITIIFPKEINNNNTEFNYYLYRAENRNLDIKKEFTLDANNAHTIPANVVAKGGYTLKLKWKNNNLNYQRDFDIEWK